jgi:formamidopyrimidine-DNA glycosylase
VPELPEVERAVIQLREHLVGHRIAVLELHHASLRRRLTLRQRKSVVGLRVVGVRRRGKHQLIDLEDGRVLHAHFRMTGDWVTGPGAATARYPRATIGLDDGSRVVLDDPRALSTLEIDAVGADSMAGIGPDADDPSLTAAWLEGQLSKRKTPIKMALLDQGIVSGIGNIYAAESLWRARIDPRRPARSLDRREVSLLLRSIRAVLRRATGARYTDRGARFDVYDREGRPCRRCRHDVERITQAGRSTYFCPSCQR